MAGEPSVMPLPIIDVLVRDRRNFPEPFCRDNHCIRISFLALGLAGSNQSDSRYNIPGKLQGVTTQRNWY